MFLRRRSVNLPLLVSGLVFFTIMSGAWSQGSESQKSAIRPCPYKPNCVSSRDPEGPRRMDPVRYQRSVQEARQRLLEILRSLPRSTVVQDNGNYIKVEFRSAIFSFVDDTEFEFDDPSKLIHFRSASRVGYYDFGVNRRRMATIIRKFLACSERTFRTFPTLGTLKSVS